MGTQRYLIEDIERKGVRHGDVPMPMVHAIERIRTVGDDVGGIVGTWLNGGLTRDEMLIEAQKRLSQASTDLGTVAYWTGKLDLT